MAIAFLDHPRPLAFAHRGGAAHAPENSMRAFEHAVGLGYQYLETDVQATADGVLIAFHDRTLARVTGHPGRIARMAYRQLDGVLIDGTEPIPRLEDLLCAWPGLRFNIDVKDAPAIGPLAEVLRRTNAWDRVCVVSFSTSRLRATRRVLDRPVCMAAPPLGAAMVRLGGSRGPRDSRGPDGRRGALRLRRRAWQAAGPGRVGLFSAAGPAVVGAAAAGTAGTGCAGRVAATAPPPSYSPRLLAEWVDRTGVVCLQVPHLVVTPSLISRAHTLGLQLHAWTVNDRATMERLLDLGVDGIMTDETAALKDVLAGRGQWHPRPAS
jgi:glycerophosphoryl diester phosphodiesterase